MLERLISTRGTLAKCIFYRIGKGDSINYWEDPWVPDMNHFLPNPRHPNSRNTKGMVDSLLLPNDSWNWRKLKDLFDDNTVSNIKKNFWVNKRLDDKYVWYGERMGAFSVKSAYKLTQNSVFVMSDWWKFLWSIVCMKD